MRRGRWPGLPRLSRGPSCSAVPPRRPQLLFAREDSAGSVKQAEPAVRNLIVGDGFVVADEIDIALAMLALASPGSQLRPTRP